MKTSFAPRRASHLYVILVIILTILFNISLLSAQSVTYSGQVLDQEKTPLPYVNVLLRSQSDSSLIKGELTDDNGYYSFAINDQDLYFIEAMLIGYSTATLKSLEPAGTQPRQLPDLILTTGVELDAVTVAAEKPLIELSAEKMIINVNSSSLSTGNSALEILAKSPGVAIDQNNNVSLKGRDGVLITINGKNQYLSTEDVARMLENMPASGIERIEIITNPSAKYDAEGNSGIINIVLSRNENLGINGQLSTSARQGIRFSHNQNANLNYRSSKLSFLGAAEYYDWNNYHSLNLIRNIPSENGVTNFDQLAIMEHGGNGFNLRFALDYEITPTTTIGLMTRFNNGGKIQDNDNVTNIIGSTEIPFNRLEVQGDGDEQYRNSTYNFNLEHRFNDQAKINFDLDYNTHRNATVFNYENNYFTTSNERLNDPFYLRNFQDIDVDIIAIKSDFTWAASDKINFETGLKLSQVNTINSTVFEFLDQQTWTNQPERTNTFDYEESVAAAYLNTNVQVGKIGLQAGLRIERTNSIGFSATLDQTVDRSYINLFPSLSISQPINDNHQLSYSYSYRLNRPNYNNLNPFEFFLDDFTRGAGNPFLNPQYSHSLGTNYAWKNKLYVSLNYSRTNDQINQVIEQRNEENITISTSDNLDNFTNLSLSVSIPKVWSEALTSRLNYVAFYNEFTSPVQAGFLNNSLLAHRFYLSNNLTLPNDWSLEISGNYNSTAVYGFFFSSPRGSLDLGVSKKFGKRCQLKINLSDVLRTQNGRHYVKTGDVDLIDNSIFDSRRLGINFSWNFGNSKVKSVRKRETAGESERGRI